MGATMSAVRDYGLDEDHKWPVPPEGGWTADDLDRLPNLPPHTELIDGSLVFMSPQTYFHMAAMRLLENALLRQVPEDLEVIREMTIKLSKRDRPEPDLMVVPFSALTDVKQTWYAPEDILLAVEIVSEDSEERDSETKPRKYALYGIRHYWRVEEEDGEPVVYAFELDRRTGAYMPAGVFRKQLRLDRPFPLEIDLTSLRRPRPRKTD
ncbi:Uma2 family endonuclease [Streptomyces sp. PR69]|uniref:Uma2 family endonuclease n=1 Tax=Streptomyces sp. PR69 TaxID=2984950 RepID=UPI003A5C3D11